MLRFKFPVISVFFLAFASLNSVPANAQSGPLSGLIAILSSARKAAVHTFHFQLSSFNSERELVQLGMEVREQDRNCVNRIKFDSSVVEELAKLTAGNLVVKRLNEMHESRELLMLITNEIRAGSACKFKRFKIYFLNGSGLIVDLR